MTYRSLSASRGVRLAAKERQGRYVRGGASSGSREVALYEIETAVASGPCGGCEGSYREGDRVAVYRDARDAPVMHESCAHRKPTTTVTKAMRQALALLHADGDLTTGVGYGVGRPTKLRLAKLQLAEFVTNDWKGPMRLTDAGRLALRRLGFGRNQR